MGVEWVKSPDTLKPVQFARKHTTAADVIRGRGFHARWLRTARLEDGVVHVFQRDLARDSRNPLDITISFAEQPETVELANNDPFQMVSHVTRTPELPEIAYCRFGSPGEPVFSSTAPSLPASPRGSIPSLNWRSPSAAAFRSCVSPGQSFVVNRKWGFSVTPPHPVLCDPGLR